MTLIVGIRCSAGVVLGADGAATYGAVGRTTIRQSTHKLQIVDGRVVIGTSGPVGLGQLMRARLEESLRAGSFTPRRCADSAAAMRKLREDLWNDVLPAIEHAKAARHVFGDGPAAQSALAYSLVALPVANSPKLIQLGPQCDPEEATEDLPFVAIGSGQPIADPFLAFLREVFWPSPSVPTVADGIFAVTWTLDHAIRTNPGGVADPIEVVVLDQEGENCSARHLSDDDLAETRESVAAAVGRLRAFRRDLEGGAVDEEEVEDLPEPA